ncbi:MAG TPA: hypothetical protein VFQ61_06465 [Polyangiaceae bacterium]|nr:hypothetical protein [Polyangiaceae bacterium]
MKKSVLDMSPGERDRIARILEIHSPRVLPAGWFCIERYENASTFSCNDGLRVIVEAEQHGAALWLHVSLSRPDRIPSYEDQTRVKTLFIGRRRTAIQVFPPEAKHVNVHPYCLHLWSPIDHEPLPDFRSAEGLL